MEVTKYRELRRTPSLFPILILIPDTSSADTDTFFLILVYSFSFLIFSVILYSMILFEVSTKKLTYVVFATGIFFAVLAGFVFRGMTEPFDKTILLFLEGARTPFWNELFLVLTYLGSVEFVSIATACFGLILLIKKKKRELIFLFTTVVGSSTLILLLKDLIGRIRPMDTLAVYSETSFSFPSGHTSISVVFYGIIAYIFAQKFTNIKTRTNILFFWIFFMAMIGFSRMYLGVHYASDVLGGYLIGFLCLSVGIILFEKHTNKTRLRSK